MMIDADSDVVSFAEIVLRLPHESRKREESRQYESYIHFLPKHLSTISASAPSPVTLHAVPKLSIAM